MIEPTFTDMYNGTYHVTNPCVSCGHVTKADVQGPDLFQYRQGAMAQVAFPYLSATQREALFISGICGFCWDNLFPAEDDESEDWVGLEDDTFDDYPPSQSGEEFMAAYINSDSNIAYLNG